MSLPAWKTDESIVAPCKTDRESWQCKNMVEREGDTSMDFEHYDCKVCGRSVKLDYDEMR